MHHLTNTLRVSARLLWALSLITLLAACSEEEDSGNTQQDANATDTSGSSGSSGDTSSTSDTSGTSTEGDTADQDTHQASDACGVNNPCEDTSGEDTSDQDTSGEDTSDQDTSDPDMGDAGDTSGGGLTEAEAWAFLDDCFSDTPLGGVLTVVDFVNRDANIYLRLAIDPEDRFGTSGTTPYDLIRFGAVQGEDAVCVTDRDLLDYELSHHNFDDYAVANIVSDDDVTCRVHMTLEYGEPAIRTQAITCTLTGTDTVVFGPTGLEEAGCRSVPEGAGCIYRTETP